MLPVYAPKNKLIDLHQRVEEKKLCIYCNRDKSIESLPQDKAKVEYRTTKIWVCG